MLCLINVGEYYSRVESARTMIVGAVCSRAIKYRGGRAFRMIRSIGHLGFGYGPVRKKSVAVAIYLGYKIDYVYIIYILCLIK